MRDSTRITRSSRRWETWWVRATALFAGAFTAFAQDPAIQLRTVVTGPRNPTDIQSARDGSGRLFIVQQQGRIYIFRDGAIEPYPFLDISERTVGSGERGLLGLAFPPDFAARQRFYVNYTDRAGHTVIAMYRVGANPDQADRDSETVLLQIQQPFSNHNGGALRFGPDDMLWIAMGDGGSGGDPRNYAQTRTALLGKMLRLDVESQPGRALVPPDNPFVGDSSWRPEIWSRGLRNPWRFSFDRLTGDVWIGDVGQDAFEEVNFAPRSSRGGENYGWNPKEGKSCFLRNCSSEGLVDPVADYPHSQGCSVTGGYVYRGTRSPGLRGTFLYGDFCSGRMWGARREGASWVVRVVATGAGAISTFGEDEDGEIYVADHNSGRIARIEGRAAPEVVAALNPATFEEGLIPGSLADIYTYGVRAEAGVRGPDGVAVTVNGIAALAIATANVNGQEFVRVQVPFEVSGASGSIVVTKDGRTGAAVAFPLRALQPGVFAELGVALAVHHATNTLVTDASPASAGEIVYFYANGLGAVADARTLREVRVTVDGVECEVFYAGLAPGFPGVYQINVRLPAGVASGHRDLRVTVDGVASPVVKIAVR